MILVIMVLITLLPVWLVLGARHFKWFYVPLIKLTHAYPDYKLYLIYCITHLYLLAQEGETTVNAIFANVLIIA